MSSGWRDSVPTEAPLGNLLPRNRNDACSGYTDCSPKDDGDSYSVYWWIAAAIIVILVVLAIAGALYWYKRSSSSGDAGEITYDYR